MWKALDLVELKEVAVKVDQFSYFPPLPPMSGPPIESKLVRVAEAILYQTRHQRVHNPQVDSCTLLSQSPTDIPSFCLVENSITIES